MSQFEVTTKCGVEKEFDSRSAAEEGARTHETLCESCDVGSSDISPLGETKTDGGAVVETQTEEPTEKVPSNPSVSEDPLSWVPGHFTDEIQGVPTINRKGYAVLAAQYNISVEAEPVTLPAETEFEYAEFRAVATTEDGQTYSGFGSAHVDRKDGDDEHLLAELAETRALKRATAWATGVGMTAVEELKGELA